MDLQLLAQTSDANAVLTAADTSALMIVKPLESLIVYVCTGELLSFRTVDRLKDPKAYANYESWQPPRQRAHPSRDPQKFRRPSSRMKDSETPHAQKSQYSLLCIEHGS